MATTTRSAATPTLGTVAVRGAVAAVGAAVANAALLAVVNATGAVAPIDPLRYPPVVLFSVLGAVGATVVYAVLVRRVANPDRTFIRVAAAVLVLSFVPNLGLLVSDPAATVPAVLVLMVMHVVVAAIAVAALTRRWV